MLSKKVRSFMIGCGALCAAATLWSHTAEAAFISCALTGRDGPTLIQHPSVSSSPSKMYSMSCDGEGLQVIGQARANSTYDKVEIRIRSETASLPNAYAFGYNVNQQPISGCIAHDTTAGTSWSSSPNCGSVKFLTIVLNAE